MTVSTSEIEEMIASLKDVQGVKAVASPTGTIQEIHVLVSGERSPKQTVRDIETLLLTKLGLHVDHKKISVVQLGPEVPTLPAGRLKFAGATLSVKGRYFVASVTLERNDVLYTCEREGPSSKINQLRLIAEATLGAVEQSIGIPGSLVLEDIMEIEVGGHPAVVSLVRLTSASLEDLLVGSALVKQDAWRGAANAVLDAINRRLRYLNH